MAVKLDAESLLNAVGQDLGARGRELAVRDVVADGGGASGVADGRHVWVGVVNGELIGECDCLAGELCAHGVAVVLAAVEAGVVFESLPPAEKASPEKQRFTTAAARLGRRELVELVAEHAVGDRRLATRLMVAAGELGAPSDDEIAVVHRILVDARRLPDGHARWELRDLLDAGRDMVTELEVLALRPVNDGVLDLADEAASVWSSFLTALREAWDVDPQPISDGLAAVHVQLYEASRVAPADLAGRLAVLYADLADDPFLDVPEAYRYVLGDEGIDEFWDQAEE
ncbi:hypothetical protein [Lentzea roselyniae]|uniref:hypothetical protein n=1 Tax=Lentzea roselyniae TaxID=531940 RepID=UPI0031F75658